MTIKQGKAALFLLPCFPYLWSDAALFGAPSSAQKWLRKPIQEAHFAAGISGSWNPSSAKIRPSTMKGEVPVAYTLFLKPLSFNFNQGHALKIGPVFRGRIYDQPSLFTQGGVGAGFFYQHPFFECLFNPMAETPVPHSFDLSFRFPKLPRFLSGLQGVIHPQAFYAGEVEGKERSQLPIYPFSLAPVLSFGKHGFLRGIVNLSPEKTAPLCCLDCFLTASCRLLAPLISKQPPLMLRKEILVKRLNPRKRKPSSPIRPRESPRPPVLCCRAAYGALATSRFEIT